MSATVDRLDLRILGKLQEDGRRPFTRIAAELGVSEATIRARVSRLTRRNAVKFVAEVDPHELGLVFAYVGIKVNGKALKRAVEMLAEIPEMISIVVCAGSFDLITEVACATNDDLLRVLQDEIRQTPGVEQVEAFVSLRIAKDVFRYPVLADQGTLRR